MNNTGKKNYSIEAVRFLLCVIIVYFHILHENILPATNGTELYLVLKDRSAWAAWCVEGFLLISGFFLYESVCRKKDTGFAELFVDRFIRLWPVFAFYAVVCRVVFGLKFETFLSYITLLHCTGLSLSEKGIIWYIAPFFWSSILVMFILKRLKRADAAFLLSLLAYTGYALNVNAANGGLGRGIAYGFINLGLVRCLAGISLGAVINIGKRSLKETFDFSAFKGWKTARFLLCSFAETGILLSLLYLMLVSHFRLKNVLVMVILFSALLICFDERAGIVSKLLDISFMGLLGKYTYAIYVMQQVSFNILKRTFWKNTAFLVNHVYASIVLSLLFSILVGIIIYYMIERPAAACYNTVKRRIRMKCG